MAVRYVIALGVARAWCLNGVAKGVGGETVVFGVRHRGARGSDIVAVRAKGEVHQRSRAGDAEVLLDAGEGGAETTCVGGCWRGSSCGRRRRDRARVCLAPQGGGVGQGG